MDCDKLKENIEDLKERRGVLGTKFEEMNESGKGAIDARRAMRELNASENEILEGYLEDFIKKNPELERWEIGEKIGGIGRPLENVVKVRDNFAVLCDGRNLYGYTKIAGGEWKLDNGPAINLDSDRIYLEKIDDGPTIAGTIRSVNQLPRTFVCGFDENGRWEIQNEVFCFDDHLEVSEILTSIALEDGKALLGGYDGALYECNRGPDGKWKLGERVDGFEAGDVPVSVTAMAKLEEGRILIGGGYPDGSEDGVLYEYVKADDGEWRLKIVAKYSEISYPFEPTVRFIKKIEEGRALISGGYSGNPEIDSGLFEYKKGDDGAWGLEPVAGFYNARGIETFVNGAVELGEGKMLLWGSDGTLREYVKGKDGEWSFGELIPFPYGIAPEIDRVVRLSENSVLIGEPDLGCFSYSKTGSGEWSLDLETVSHRSPYKVEDGKFIVQGFDNVLYEYAEKPLTAERLKSELDVITRKGEE